ncbi:MAG TPA: PQQ-dependent sugar dehydrogenase [Beijerinckiaceae bacterium]|nr:PQQ-dependent sugar dehydrogenase [Beijerinckiaceae bacterium]
MSGIVRAACFIAAAFPAMLSMSAASLAENVPPGFHVAALAHVAGAREIAPCGRMLYVGRAQGNVSAVALDSGKVTTIAGRFEAPNGVACSATHLYVADRTRIIAYPLSPDGTISGAAATIHSGFPDLAHHGLRYIAVGPDARLYVSIGSPCNICKPQGLEGTIVSMNPDGSGFATVAHGIRNSVGFDWSPSGTLFFTDNGADDMGDNIPPDELNEVNGANPFFGFPYFGGRVRLKGFETAEPPQPQVAPVFEFQAHVATLGLHFYRGAMLGLDGDAFVAEHGSWNRSVPVGRALVLLRFQGGRPTSVETFARGIGRPVDVKELADGALVVSDDAGGTIWHITR